MIVSVPVQPPPKAIAMRHRPDHPRAATRTLAASLPLGEGLVLAVILFIVLAMG